MHPARVVAPTPLLIILLARTTDIGRPLLIARPTMFNNLLDLAVMDAYLFIHFVADLTWTAGGVLDEAGGLALDAHVVAFTHVDAGAGIN